MTGLVHVPRDPKSSKLLSELIIELENFILCDLYTAFKHTIHMCRAGHQYMWVRGICLLSNETALGIGGLF